MRLLFRVVLTPLLVIALLAAGVSFAVATGSHTNPPSAEEVYPCVPASVAGVDPDTVAALIDQYYGDGDGVLDIDQISAAVARYFGGNQAEIANALNQYFGGGLSICDPDPECPTGQKKTTGSSGGSSCVPECPDSSGTVSTQTYGGGGGPKPTPTPTPSNCKPSVSTGSACPSKTTAKIYGTAVPNGLSTKVRFEYGLTTSLGSVTAYQNIGSGKSSVAFSTSLSGLAPNTTYYYRAVAENSAGTIQGSIKSFKTKSAPPSASTDSATPTDSTASLKGTVNPNGASAGAHFEWGKSSSSLSSSTADQDLGKGIANLAVSASITGLHPATTYYYKVVAEGAGGTTSGAVKSFTTPTAAPSCVTGASSSISKTGAKLAGTADPNGVSTTVWFDYGKSATALTSKSATSNVGSGAVPAAASATLGSLTSNTKYYYRVSASSSKGTCAGSVLSFTTAK